MAHPSGHIDGTTRRRIQWSPRQREVLNLLAKGRTNGQIATELGISLDGAKWHVSEVITKLDVDTREEAAEWWRQQQGLRARLRVLTRTGMSPVLVPGVFRWAGLGALAVSATAAVAIAAFVILDNDGGDQPAAPGQTPSPVATEPGSTATSVPGGGDDDSGAGPDPTPGAPAEIAGVPVRVPQPGSPVSMENLSILIVTGCWECDGPAESLLRLYEDTAGELVRDTLFTASGGEGRYIAGYDIAPDMSRMLVTVCSTGYCGGMSDPTADAELTVYESTDGGLTWETLGELDAADRFIASITYAPDGGYLVRRAWRDDEDAEAPAWRQEIARWPSGSPVREWPEGQAAPVLLDDGTLLTVDEDGQRILQPDGSVSFDLTDADLAIHGVTNPVGVDGLLVTFGGAGDTQLPHYLALLRDGSFAWVVQMFPASTDGGMHLYMHNLAGETALLATEVYPAGRPHLSLPAFIDAATGTVHHLEGPFGSGFDEGEDDDIIGGRNYLVAARSGPFARVDTDGSCLNVRDAPDTESEIVRCYVDGVLLVERDNADAPDGWLAVRTPDGRDAFASTDFLAR